MNMTFDEYIKNPMGVKNAVFSQREMFHKLYVEKLDKILVREMGKINYYLYNDTPNRYLIHLKIPSEVVEKFYYDTVIEFYTENPLEQNNESLSNYSVKFYSNDPYFVYTFAHSFLKNDVFIRDLVPRMSKEAVTKAAKERNPKNVVGYVKSIYFAYLIMKNRGLFKKQLFHTYGTKYNKKELLTRVEHATTKIGQREEEGKKKNKKKVIDQKKREVVKSTYNRKEDSNSSNVVKTVGKVKTVLSSVTTKRIKRK